MDHAAESDFDSSAETPEAKVRVEKKMMQIIFLNIVYLTIFIFNILSYF